ncbi:MAG TPA: phosphoribosylanthranilate isomerase [Gemmatimonadaceae bacterium]|nr:phosphoribosylanthranilate isomerase [Gemmatimonadaceae bacterium]
MPVETKFCGLTRPEDAAAGAAAGAAYLGVVFASGPRRVEPARAREVFDAASGAPVRRVGVFGRAAPAEVASAACCAGLQIAQLHGDPAVEDVRAVREACGCEVWACVRLDPSDAALPTCFDELAVEADAILLDTRVRGQLGGTGVALPWERMAESIRQRLHAAVPGERRVRIVLAGGLTPESVARAIECVAPAVVDVSSGVERSPGIKDHERMRAFVAAVRATSCA